MCPNVCPLGPSPRALPAVGGILVNGVDDPRWARRVAYSSKVRAPGNILIHTLRAGIPVASAAAPCVDRRLRAIAVGGRHRASIGVACRAVPRKGLGLPRRAAAIARRVGHLAGGVK